MPHVVSPGQKLSRRQLMKLGSAFLLSGCGQQGRTAGNVPEERPNVIVYLPDAMRADGLGCYGNAVPTSPAIDAFSRQGVLFERCFSQATWTKPSVASLFTGLLPPVHQAVITDWDTKNVKNLRVQVLRECFTTLAETFQAMGYTTACISVNPHTQQEFGFARGFDSFRYEAKPVAKQMEDVLSWLSRAKGPFFLFVHALDPHGPYIPSKDNYHKLFGTTPEASLAALPGNDKELLAAFKTKYIKKVPQVPLNKLTKNGVAYLRNLYDAEIRGVDRQFERLLGFLERRGLDEHSIVALISDHGEGFGEHGRFGHGNTLCQEDLHVPMILRGPRLPQGQRVPWSVAQFDLGPTLTTLAGGTTPEGIQAQPLVDAKGNLLVAADRDVFSYIDYYTPDTGRWDACLIRGDAKIISAKSWKEYWAYDLKNDPGEKKNLFNEPGGAEERFLSMKTALDAEHDRHLRLAKTFGDAEWTMSDEELREQLNAMGYI